MLDSTSCPSTWDIYIKHREQFQRVSGLTYMWTKISQAILITWKALEQYSDANIRFLSLISLLVVI